MKLRKILSIFLALTLMMGLMCVNLPAEAESTTTWLDFEAKEMPYYLGDDTDWDAWSIDPSTPYNCATWYSWGYAQKDGAWAIRELVVPNAGTLTIETIWGAVGIYQGGSASDSIQFGIANGNKELVWPSDGNLRTVTENTKESVNPDLSMEVEAGESVYFIIGNPTKASLAYYAGFVIRLNGTQLQGTDGYLFGNTDGMAVQGGVSQNGAKWYYKYADSVEVTTADPDGVSDLGQDVYEAVYTTEQMTKISTSNNGWIGAGSYGSTSFAQGMNLYLRAGQTNIVRYTAPEDGYFSIGYCGVELNTSVYYPDAWTEEKGLDFAIVNQDGEVIWPAYGGAVEVRGTDDPNDQATVPSRVYVYNMEAGDYLDFVYIPTATVPTFGTAYVTTSGSFSFNGDRIDSSGRLALSNSEEQGARNVQMLYSTDFAISKKNTSVWTEFVQLESALTAVPATVEVQVNVPTTVEDWKVGTVISDMYDPDGTGFAVMMNTFGRPRFVSGNVDWTANIDIRTGEWLRLTFTVDTANGTLSAYCDGVLADQTTLAEDAAPAVSGMVPVIGGDRSYSSTTAFQGAMKKLALSASVSDASAELTPSTSTNYWLLNGVYTDKVAGNNGKLSTVNTMWYEGTPEDAADDEYTVVHIGDMQVTSDFMAGTYPQVTQWIVDNADRLNIQTVINSGDLVNNEDETEQWEDAKAGMDVLTNNGISIVYGTGNHEYPSSGTKARTADSFNAYFPIDSYLTQGTEDDPTKILYAYPSTDLIDGDASNLTVLDSEGAEVTDTTDILVDGVLAEGYSFAETLENVVYTKTINGTPHIFFVLEVQPRITVVDNWAKTVMAALEASETYANAPVTVITHHYLTTAGKIDTTNGCFTEAHRTECYTPAELYSTFISQYKNIRTVLCGHVADDIATRTDIGANGNKIVSIMNDQSYEGDGGEGVILLLRYRADGTVKAEYYSPILGRYYQASNQFEYDTADEGDDWVMDLSSMKEMGYYSSGTWYIASSKQSATYPYLQYRAMAVAGDYATIRSYQAGNTGTLSFTLAVLTASSNVEVCVCKDDGTVVWPTTGTWSTPSSSSTRTVSCDIEAGEKIHIIVKRIDTTVTSRATEYTEVRSGTIKVDGTTVESFSMTSSSSFPTTQGENGWYSYYATASKLKLVPPAYTVNYGVEGDVGGSITATTGGTWAASSCTVPTGGTVRFTTKPAAGYRFVGYYVNGELITAYRQYTMSNINADADVRAVFEKIPLVGDANNDGVVDVLDAVHLNVGIATDAAIIDDTVCDLVDDIAATDGVDILDIDDVKALRKEILG